MITMREVQKKLRKNNRKNYTLYAFCNFISLMLITAYSAMMLSPTVLTILPEGGDSRKQMLAVFALACVGCVVFTIYAAGLFFRKKSKEIGTMMALGASKKRLAPGVISETVTVSGFSALAGTLAGIPFAWLIWHTFRLLVVDSDEMKLTFDLKCYLISAAFMLLVIGAAMVLGVRYLRKTNIMDVIHEEHKNEPVRPVGRKCGILGITILLIGAVAGYFGGSVYKALFQAYAPVWINILYAPVFIGLYMILLHTVVNGWKRRKNHYKGIISRSMMKFQGKQTVNNMLVVTVLLAGACFGIFYLPMMGTGQVIESSARPYDYAFFSPADNDFTEENNIEHLAEGKDIAIEDYENVPYITLAMDGEQEVEDEGTKFHMEYEEFLMEGRFLSESHFSQVAGQKIAVSPGEYHIIGDDEGNALYSSRDTTLLTNMTTMDQLKVKCSGNIIPYGLLYGSDRSYYILDDEDYAAIEIGLAGEWQERLACFNVKNDTYAFARTLYEGFIASMDEKEPMPSYYDRVAKYQINQKGEVYWGDTDEMTRLSFDKPDSTEFRQYWAFMPKIRTLDQNDFMKTFAVFMMMFLFIAIICTLSALVICYTRCMTIAINNRYVFDDLKRLGASPKFLNKELRSQAGKVFTVPAIVGMSMMYLLYLFIMYANDGGKLTFTELASMGVCLVVELVLGLIVFAVYRMTVSKMRRQLGISKA